MNVLTKFIRIGSSGIKDKSLSKKVVLANILSLSLILLVLIYTIIALVRVPEIVPYLLASVPFFLLVILLNSLGQADLSRIIISLASISLLSVMHAFMVKEDGAIVPPMFVFQLATLVVPWVVFNSREGGKMLFCTGYGILLLASFDTLNEWFQVPEGRETMQSVWVQRAVYAGALAFAFFNVYFLQKIQKDSDDDTEALINEIQKRREESEKEQEESKKFLEELEKSREEESNRSWIASGLENVNNLIRKHEDPDQLAQEVLSEIINYLGANQGVIYLMEKEEDSEEEYLELKAAYAYGRRKHLKEKVKPGEGLVGQVMLEKDPIYLTEIPEDYIRISSGLGQALPTCVTLLPMVSNDIMEGVLEIASFHELKDHEIEYLKRLSENLASSFNLNKINFRTKQLLQLSQQQQEEVRNQSEELQQNMEEIQATQEEMERKNKEIEIQNQELLAKEEELKQNMEELTAQSEELENQLTLTEEMSEELKARENVLNESTIISESDLYGTIIYTNDKLCEVAKYSREEMIGKAHNLFRHPDMPKEVFKLLWTTIKAGKIFRGIIKNRAKDGSVYWVDAVIAPVLDRSGKPKKYVGVRYVIEEEEIAMKLFNQQLDRLGIARK